MKEKLLTFKKMTLLDSIIYRIRTGVVKKNIKSGVVICDLGCRKGASFLREILPNIKYGYGFDIDAVDLKEEKIETKKLDFDSGKIPLNNESVDCVIMSAVLEHLNNPENIVKEANRILKKEGVFIITTPSIYSKPVIEFLAFKLGIINKADILEHKKYFKASEIVDLFYKCGFLKENIKCSYFEMFFNVLVVAKK